MSEIIITHLFRKKEKGLSVTPEASLVLERGYGIEGDRNASPISPRQVLITRQEDLEELHIPFGGLRENIIIQGSTKEKFLPGALLQIGDVKIRLTFYCEPCQRIADVVPSLPAVFHKRGILGVIIEGGEMKVGDSVLLKPNTYTALSENPTERFLEFIKLIPVGKVVTYKTVAKAMGVAEGFIRAMPGYIKRVVGTDIPVRRIVDVEGNLIDKHIPEQKVLLEEEGVAIVDNRIDLSSYMWQEEALFLK